MIKYLTLMISILLLSFSSIAQNATISGTIVEKENNKPIENATLHIVGYKSFYTTDNFGNFNFKKLNCGKYLLEISHIGFETKQVSITLKDNTNIALKVIMNKTSLTFKSITLQSIGQSNYSKIADIDKLLRPINSSQDLLKIVPSLFIAQHAGGGKAEQIFLRGFDIDHGTDISITVDGMPVNMISHAHGQGYADLHFLIPETVDKINFDKGPYNAEKGNLATAGFVDFKTKDFIDNNSIKIEAGKFNTQRISGLLKTFNKQTDKNKQQIYLASELYKSNGYFDAPQHFNRFNIAGKYNYTNNNNTKINVLFSSFKSKWSASGQIPERAVSEGLISKFGSIDNLEGGTTSRTNATIIFNKKYNSNWNITQQLYYTNYNFNLFSNFTFFLNDSLDGDMINQKEQRNIYGYMASAKKSNFLFAKRAVTTFGIGVRYDNVGNISLASAPKRAFNNYIQNGSIKEANYYAFINETINATNKFSINTSLRFDNFNFGYKDFLKNENQFRYKNKSTFSPKLTLNYNTSSNTNLFFSNGLGFHSNDTRVILKDSVSKILPKVYGTDIGITTKPSKNIYLKTIFWHLFSEQEFVYVGDAGVVEPSGASRRYGVDVMARWQISKWLFSDVDVSIAKARSIMGKKNENYIPLAPLFTSIGGLTAKVNSKLSASLRYRFMDNRPANEDYSVTAKGYFLADAVVNYKYKKADFNLSFENVFNSNWKEAQFNTESRLENEPNSVTEIHFTPGTPFFVKAGIGITF